MDGLPNNLQDAKVAVIGGDIKIRSMTRDAQIKISSAGQLESFVNAEQARKEDIAARILATGADVILCGGEIDTEILHILADNEILAIAQLDESELRNSADATSSSIIDSILDASPGDLGECGSLTWERNESTDMVEDIIRIDGC